MREIKFRAWDKITKKLYAVSGLEFDENGEVCEVYLAGIQIDESNPTANVRKPSDVILNQYTGLKDKNGKEIYEGDIVLVANHGLTPFAVIYREWDCSFLCGNEFAEDYVHMFKSLPQCYEVIGNIHKNPEFLSRKEEE